MKRIGITSLGENIDSIVGDCFGKNIALVLDWDNGVKGISVVNVQQTASCVGPLIADELANHYKVEAVITGTIGCSAYSIFENKCIGVYQRVPGITVEQAARAYFGSLLNEIKAANSPGGSRCGTNHKGCGSHGKCGGCHKP